MSLISHAQTPCGYVTSTDTLPVKCLEIESLLVNACTNSEGFDEMVNVRIGPSPIMLSSITNVQWPTSNIWQGWASFSSTNLNKLTTINNAISAAGNCGKVIKLNPSDIIPAYGHLLIITSTLFNATAQDFSGLTDTLYVALQSNTTVTRGHFSNTIDNSLRRFILGISSGCADTVDHYGDLMIKANGSFGSEDGSGVEFTYGGKATYFNDGCKIPAKPFKVDAGIMNGIYCSGDTVKLAGTTIGALCSWWYPKNRNAGRFIDSTLASPQFLITPDFSGSTWVYLKAIGNCSIKIDSVEIKASKASGKVKIQPATDTLWCRLNPINLSLEVTGTNPVVWFHDGKGSLVELDSIHQIYIPSSTDTQRVNISAMQISACKNSFDTLTIRFVDPPTAVFKASDTMICYGVTSMVQFAPKMAGGIFSGTGVVGKLFFPDTPGIYPITHVINIGGCADTSIQRIHVLIKPDASFTMTDSIVCTAETNITFTPINSGGIWLGANITGNSFIPLVEGIYHITYAINNGACIDSTSKNIVVGDRPNSSFTFPDSVLCIHDPAIQLTPTTLGGTFSGPFIIGSNFQPNESGLFTLTYILTHQGCTDSTQSQIRVAPLPLPFFIATPDTTWVNTEIMFSYQGIPMNKFEWDFGDGHVDATPLSSKHIYLKDNFYDVGLQVTSNDGCVGATNKRIMILAEEKLFVPNVFTPNGDLLNETFHLSHSNVHKFNLWIYNRWGELMFHTENPDQEWDGKFEGKPCSEGVYVYLINYSTLEGKYRTLNGTVSLLR